MNLTQADVSAPSIKTGAHISALSVLRSMVFVVSDVSTSTTTTTAASSHFTFLFLLPFLFWLDKISNFQKALISKPAKAVMNSQI